jgi:dTDP-glucose 4,6-dehydratase
MILVTGGAGFIGSNFIKEWFSNTEEPVVVIDKLSYAGDKARLENVSRFNKIYFYNLNINDRLSVKKILNDTKPRSIFNFAAETHVDRSINSSEPFVESNIIGTHNLLEAARDFWINLSPDLKNQFRYVQISTDEVYGSLAPNDPPFTEDNSYKPNSPYSATKAAADHLVRAWFRTYGLPVLTTHCSNNYGYNQFPEKLIPVTIINAICQRSIDIYGNGQQIRDWLHVKDHCSAIRQVFNYGVVGESYNISAENQIKNIDLVNQILKTLSQISPQISYEEYVSKIRYVTDRKGHDERYAVDSSKIRRELGWKPLIPFTEGLRDVVNHYLSEQNQYI